MSSTANSAATAPLHGDLDRVRARLVTLAATSGAHEDAEDAAQEALSRAWANQRVDAATAVGWLTVVTRNLAVDMARRRGRDAQLLDRASLWEPPVPDPSEEVLDRHLSASLRRCIEQLPERQREVVRLIADGCSLAEAARLMGITERAAEGHLSRARKTLRAHAR